METYSVRRHDTVKFISAALRESGIEIVREADPTSAPFVFDVILPDTTRRRLVCYAFTANKYQQAGRPTDEHRFQIKYGSDFSRYHHLHLPARPDETTLMFGVHFERRLIVAVDPAMHQTTWFSKSVEFKEEQVQRVEKEGWYGWERQRVQRGRRKLPLPDENTQDEVLLGLKPNQMLRYIKLETVASGTDAGTRLRVIEEADEHQDPVAVVDTLLSDSLWILEHEMGFSASEIADEILHAFRLKVALRGSIAERHLERALKREPGIEYVERIDEDGQPDIRLRYRDSDFTVECKNVLRTLNRYGQAKVDFQKTRASKGDPCSRYYAQNQFDVLAACLQPVTTRWEFRFTPTSRLEPHRTCPGRLSQTVYVNEQAWDASPVAALDRILLSD